MKQVQAIKQKNGSYILSYKRDDHEIKIPFHTRKSLCLHLKKMEVNKEECTFVE